MKPQPNRKRIACLAVGLLVLLALAVPAHAEVNATPVYMSGPNIDAVNAYNQAGDLAAQGKLEDALKETERALSIQPNFSLALAQKAGLQNALGNYTEGLASADAALKGNPDIAEDRRRLEDFKRTREAIPLSDVKAWVESWGTERELPRP